MVNVKILKKEWLSIEDVKDILGIMEHQQTTDRDTQGEYIWIDGTKTIYYYIDSDYDIVVTRIKNESNYIKNY